MRDGLLKAGIDCWLDVNDLHLGEILESSIIKAIKNSLLTLVIVSNNIRKSDWVRQEVEQALSNLSSKDKDRIIPIVIEGNMKKILPLRLKDRKALDMRNINNRNKELEKLIKEIRFKKDRYCSR